MPNHTYRIGVLGASGYTGGELLRYLAGHPHLEVAWATADRNAGKKVGDVFGHLPHIADLILAPTDPGAAPELDLAFLALPHGGAAGIASALSREGCRVVDLSADHRLTDATAYPSWYGWTHPDPDGLSDWIYGLPEVYRDTLAGAERVANPGCYPTAALLPLVPALRADVVSSSPILVDAASGVSGAGRKVDAAYLYGELDGTYAAYGVGTHRHTPEIEQELSSAAGTGIQVTFTPHLTPMTRGLLATCYAPLKAEPGQLRAALEEAYADEPFVHVLDRQPTTKLAAGSNHAFIGVGADQRTGTAVLTCAIDNLGKGAAGQAIQNANLMLGLPETAGLDGAGVYP